MTIVQDIGLAITRRSRPTETQSGQLFGASTDGRGRLQYRPIVAVVAALGLMSCAQVQGHNVGAKDYFLEVEQGPLPHKGGTYGEASEALASHVPDYCAAGWRRIAEHTRVDDTGQTWLSWVVRCD